MSFNSLGLSSFLLKAIKDGGYETPTSIQEKAIPIILKGKDVLGTAQTGTGKTAGFTLPLLEILKKSISNFKSKKEIKVRALILTPTRELASQVGTSVYRYGKYSFLKSVVIFGGANIYPQTKALRRGVDIVVATPGRLLDHIRQGNLNLSSVEVFVLDEADRMLDMGFIDDILSIVQMLPKNRQTLLFSATFSKDIKNLSSKLLNNPEFVEAQRENSTAKNIKQSIYYVDREKKKDLLSFLISSKNIKQALVFASTKSSVDRLAEDLRRDGMFVGVMHGDKTQSMRTKVLKNFKEGRIKVLVATDLASRGLDIDSLPYVFNYDLPVVAEDYVHRIGRTGRAGNFGEAISLVSVEQVYLLRDIQKLIASDINVLNIPEYSVNKSVQIKIDNGDYDYRKKRQSSRRNYNRNSKPRTFNNTRSYRGHRRNDENRKARKF